MDQLDCNDYGTELSKICPKCMAELHLKISALQALVDELIMAIKDEGPEPRYHHNIMDKHREEWPTLWCVIDKIQEARRKER